MSDFYSYLPEPLRSEMRAYIECGERPGQLALAFLQNDLAEAVFALAASHYLLNELEFVSWLHRHAPQGCFGSPEKVRTWIYWRSGQFGGSSFQ